MKIENFIAVVVLIFVCSACCQHQATTKVVESKEVASTDWKSIVEQKLKIYGHRNWIVIADSAYPEQSNPAIETISINASQLEAVAFVNELVSKAAHVDANIFVDKEMVFVSEKNAKGISKYRGDLIKILQDSPVKTILHEDIIGDLDESAKLFNVLILKTDLAIPYTSVFFQLECGYWNAASEKELREALNGSN